LGIGDWGLGPIPNPQSPIPKFIVRLNFVEYYLIYDIQIIINSELVILS